MGNNTDDEYPDVEAETSFDIQLYIYDMTKGMAKMFSAMFLGKELPGIWHTSIIAYGREYFFGGMGIESCQPGATSLGHPDQIVQLGKTELPYSLFLEYIFSLGESTFHGSKYNLFEHNCNNFSNEIATLLTGKGIPQEILDLPSEILATPLGQTIAQYIGNLTIRPQGTGVNFSSNQLPNGRCHHKTHKLANDKELQSQAQPQPSAQNTPNNAAMADSKAKDAEADANNELNNGHDAELNADGEEKKPVEPRPPRKVYKYSDPPILFKEGVCGDAAIKKLQELVKDMLSPEEVTYLKEWHEYLTTDAGAWILGNEHLDLFANLLTGDGKYAPNVPLLTLQALQAAALKDDFVLVLHQDRKDRRVMSYINRIESVTLAEQEEIAKLLCNLCSQPSSFDWLMYITEWVEDGQPTNNCRVTTRAAVHTVLNEQLTTLQRTGVSLIFNLSLKELFEDTATELATAVLQFVHNELPEDQAFMCLTSLLRFMVISYNDVPALTKMLGPDLNKFKGLSKRVDDVIGEIDFKLQTALAGKGNGKD